jgi:hypothetical protein
MDEKGLMNAPRLMTAWSACEAELLGYLGDRVRHVDDAKEVLQEVFSKAMR